MSEVAAYGLAVDPPAGWESRIYQRRAWGSSERAIKHLRLPAIKRRWALCHSPVAQLATIPIPSDAADYGSDVVDELGPQDAFIVLKEFESASVKEPLFATEGMSEFFRLRCSPRARCSASSTAKADTRRSFMITAAFCLYVVLGGFDYRNQVVPRVNQALATLRIDAPSSAPLMAGRWQPAAYADGA